MKLQAVMENLHRQQRAKLLMEQQLQQQAAAQHSQVRTIVGGRDEPMGSPAPEAEQAQMAALAAMREMEEDFDDDLAEEGLPTGHEAVAPGKGILLLPHRQLHPHSQLLKARPSVDQEPRVAIMPPHATQSHLSGQDHGEWTYEEQFRQLYELDRDPKRKEFLDDLFSFMQKRGTPVNRIPIMAKQVLDLYMLYRLVTEKGGLVEVINKKLYMKYLYPYECDKRSLSNPNELQAAIDSNRREGRRQSFGSSLFTYSPNGTPTMLSSPKLPSASVGLTMGTNGASLIHNHKIKKEEDVGHSLMGLSMAHLTAGALQGNTMGVMQAAAAQATMAAQMAALEQLRDKLEAGEPPEKKMALPAEEHQRLLQRALQHNLLAMTAQLPMNIRINNQEFTQAGFYTLSLFLAVIFSSHCCHLTTHHSSRQGGKSRQNSALNLTTNGTGSISMSVELNGVMYTGVLFAQAAAGAALSGAVGSSVSNKTVSSRVAPAQHQNTPTSTSSNPLS
ncbi:hypothetical protein F7725_027827 [Dissostichus mawsoni]|uniref:AT-rich interactive domain-containing protein 3 n=1 Tax=Dissostichus mawsoni TaxID=36200 RepID=A0A7J5XF04_DISMA|nr:hypothetical protein F7725_027827 [Dissostichus mawsoni]